MYTLNISQEIDGQNAGNFTVYLLDNHTIAVDGLPNLYGWYSLENGNLVMTISNPTDSEVPNPYSATLYSGFQTAADIIPPIWEGTAYGTQIPTKPQTEGTFVKLTWSGTLE